MTPSAANGSNDSLPQGICPQDESCAKTSKNSPPAMSQATNKSIYSQELGGGQPPSTSLAGTDLFGQPVFHARRSHARERAQASLTLAASSGFQFCGSSASAALSASLASKCQQLFGTAGSTEFSQTWKRRATPAGRVYWEHTVLARRTDDSESSGWPSPQARNDTGASETATRQGGADLQTTAQTTAWPTPNTPSGGRSVSTDQMDATGKTADGKKHTASLEHAVKFVTCWTTPQAHDVTPRSKGQKAKHGTTHGCADLNADAMATSWATPTTRDHKDGASTLENTPLNSLLGRQVSLSPAPTAKPVACRLNPLFSLWLMLGTALATAWASCVPQATRSASRPQRPSSAP